MPGIDKFRQILEDHQVDESIIAQVNQGYEAVDNKSPKKERAMYFKHALDVLNEQVKPETVQEIFECGACCCKGGKREKDSKAFAKTYETLSLEEKLERIKDEFLPVTNENGILTVHAVYYSDGEKYLCACPNFNKVKREYPVSKNYCFCCAGHFKYHLEIRLGVNLKALEIVSSPLDSGGKNPCIIKFAIV